MSFKEVELNMDVIVARIIAVNIFCVKIFWQQLFWKLAIIRWICKILLRKYLCRIYFEGIDSINKFFGHKNLPKKYI